MYDYCETDQCKIITSVLLLTDALKYSVVIIIILILVLRLIMYGVCILDFVKFMQVDTLLTSMCCIFITNHPVVDFELWQCTDCSVAHIKSAFTCSALCRENNATLIYIYDSLLILCGECCETKLSEFVYFDIYKHDKHGSFKKSFPVMSPRKGN